MKHVANHIQQRWYLLANEKSISESPPNKNDNAKSTDKVNKVLLVDAYATMLAITEERPTNSGLYLCFKTSLNDFNMIGSLPLFFMIGLKVIGICCRQGYLIKTHGSRDRE